MDKNFHKVFNLLLILCLLSSFILAVFFTNDAIYLTKEKLLNRFPPIVSIQLSSEEILNELGVDIYSDLIPESFQLTGEIARELENLPHVKSSEIANNMLYLMSRDLVPFFSSYSPFSEFSDFLWENTRDGNVYYSFNAMGLLSYYPIALSTGLMELVDGRFFEANDVEVIVISQELADYNGLHVGSRVLLENTGEVLHLQKEVEVIGIFKIAQEALSNDELYDYNRIELLLNQLYIPFSLAEMFHLSHYQSENWEKGLKYLNEMGINTSLDKLLALDAFYYLVDVNNISSFWEEAREILPDFWHLVDYSSDWGIWGVVGQTSNLQKVFTLFDSIITSSFLILFFSVTGFVIVLYKLSLLILKSIMVYSGEKRVMMNLFIKSVIATSLIIVSSIFFGKVISEILPRMAIEQKLESDENLLRDMRICLACPADAMFLHDLGDIQIEEVISSYQVQLHSTMVVRISLIGFSILLILILFLIIYLLLINNPNHLIKYRKKTL